MFLILNPPSAVLRIHYERQSKMRNKKRRSTTREEELNRRTWGQQGKPGQTLEERERKNSASLAEMPVWFTLLLASSLSLLLSSVSLPWICCSGGEEECRRSVLQADGTATDARSMGGRLRLVRLRLLELLLLIDRREPEGQFVCEVVAGTASTVALDEGSRPEVLQT